MTIAIGILHKERGAVKRRPCSRRPSSTRAAATFPGREAVIPGRVLPTHQGAIRLFRLAGIDVFLHWSWFVVAVFEIRVAGGELRLARSGTWRSTSRCSLIVTMHEFGHSLACRQVGGSANRIVLWPLGGVAYVDPPQRPGATLWSIAAGPLVNVALLPILFGLMLLGHALGPGRRLPGCDAGSAPSGRSTS